jgi:hypothetical protein
MTEAEWLEGKYPENMIHYLSNVLGVRKRPGQRKIRLFAIACCYRIFDLLDEQGRKELETAERYAEQGCSEEEQKEAKNAHYGQYMGPRTVVIPLPLRAVLAAKVPGFAGTGFLAARAIQEHSQQGTDAFDAERAVQCKLLVEIFGNPFRPVSTAITTWRTADVLRLAQTIYDKRAFDRLPVLADGLEDAGCTDAQLLSHLRGPGPHVRGCWALGALLGKE